MTYHHNITQCRSIKNSRLWTDGIFLTLSIFSILAIGLYYSEAINLFYALPALALMLVLAMLIINSRKVSFIDISDGTLSYRDTSKGEMVSIPVHEITHISTRFCQLNIHTTDSVHTVNLDIVRNQKTRWEIKEMIREIARQGQAVA